MKELREEWILVDGLRIHYLAGGESGPPVVLLHGIGGDSASLSWRSLMGLLSREHRVLAPDWPGHGESDSPDTEYTTDYFTRFFESFLDALGLERASLVGSSLGAGVALGFALRAPQRVESLVLTGTFGLGKRMPMRLLAYVVVWLPGLNRMIWAAMARSRRMVRRSLRNVIYDRRSITNKLVDEVFAQVRKPGVGKAYRSWQRSEISWRGLRSDFAGNLQDLGVRTLLLHGAEDRFVPLSLAERAHALIKGSELRVFPGCRHWLPRERPDDFNRAVTEFLAPDRSSVSGRPDKGARQLG